MQIRFFVCLDRFHFRCFCVASSNFVCEIEMLLFLWSIKHIYVRNTDILSIYVESQTEQQQQQTEKKKQEVNKKSKSVRRTRARVKKEIILLCVNGRNCRMKKNRIKFDFS